jgi:hypothetical protein
MYDWGGIPEKEGEVDSMKACITNGDTSGWILNYLSLVLLPFELITKQIVFKLSFFLAYFPKVGLCDLQPVCVFLSPLLTFEYLN